MPARRLTLPSSPSLSSICVAEFTRSPRLLVVAWGVGQEELLASNDWANVLCQPEIVLVVGVAGEMWVGVERKLLDHDYLSQGARGNLMVFAKRSEIPRINNRRAEYERNPSVSSLLFEKEKHLLSLYVRFLPA